MARVSFSDSEGMPIVQYAIPIAHASITSSTRCILENLDYDTEIVGQVVQIGSLFILNPDSFAVADMLRIGRPLMGLSIKQSLSVATVPQPARKNLGRQHMSRNTRTPVRCYTVTRFKSL